MRNKLLRVEKRETELAETIVEKNKKIENIEKQSSAIIEKLN